MKKIQLKLSSLVLMLVLILNSNVFARETNEINEPSAIITIKSLITESGKISDPIFEIHSEAYKRWKEGGFSNDFLQVSGKELESDDELFAQFRKEHDSEAAFSASEDKVWHAYELDLACKNTAGSYGNFIITSSGIDDGNMYNIWPEQVEVYLSRYDFENNTWREVEKLIKGTSQSDQYADYSVIQDFLENRYGSKYKIDIDLSEDINSTQRSRKDKFRIYIFQGWPKPIPNNLFPGEYSVPLSIRYANSPGKYSMASGAVEEKGTLIVGEDKSLKLRFFFKPMTISDPAYTGGKPLNGHLEKLWLYKSIDDYNLFKKNSNLYKGKEISLDTPEFLKETYTEGVTIYPKTYEIPLEYEDGNVNYESQKFFRVKVDAMGDMDPNFNLLMRVDDMKLEKINLPSGKYNAMPLVPENNNLSKAWENNNFKWTKDEYCQKLTDEAETKKIYNKNFGIIPIYELEVKDGKADLIIEYPENYKDTFRNNVRYNEAGLIKADENMPIQYRSATNNELKNAEILKEVNFTVSNSENKHEKRITKIKLKDIPLPLTKDDEKIQLTNVQLVSINNSSRINYKPDEYAFKSGILYSVPNFDLMKKVLVEKYEETPNKKPLEDKIQVAKAIEKGNKTDEAFDTLKAAITSAEEVLNSASEQTQLDEAVTTLNKAIETFKSSPEKQAQLNKTDLDAKIKDADKISQGKKSEVAFKTLKAAIEAAKNVLNSANTQDQINEALSNLNKAIDTFNNSTDVNITPEVNEKVYNIPVKLMHSVQDKESMGNKALVSPAKVSIKGDVVNIDLTFQGIEVPLGTTKFYGHLTNLFSFKDNTTRGEAIPAEVLEQMEDNAMDGSRKQFPKVFRIKLTKDAFDNLKDNTLYVKVWVDAMDGLMGGTPGAGAQNARLVFDKSNMTEAVPGGEKPTPPTPTPTPNPNPPIPTPGLSNRTAVIEALRSYSNLGGPQYTYQSNMRYVNAYNSLMNLLSKPVVTESEVKSAIEELKSAAAGLLLDTSKSNNSGNNNSGWGNNNSGWGTNNSGWGNNNSGFGNNNSGWNNQNNNQNSQNNGPVTIQYEVPVEVLHAHQSGYSMANAAINHTARVEERDGKFRYSVNFHSIQREFGGKTLTGNLTNLFIIDGSKYRADQSGSTWSWVMNGKYDRVNVTVWVDAMDEIAGKGPGGGEQNAILSFNWNGAKEVGRVGGNNNQQNQQNQQTQSQSFKSSGSSNSFTDISGHWAKQAIDYVVGKGYFFGLSNTEFGPNKSITRGQFVTVIGRMLNVNTSIYNSQNFNDVKSSMYYSSYIAWANKMGIVSGVGQGRFAPEKELTREEMAVIMSKFLKVSNKTLNAKGNSNAFMDDGKIESWAKEAVKEMAKLGVVNGMGDGKFAPKSPFTRAQVAQVLFNIDHN